MSNSFTTNINLTPATSSRDLAVASVAAHTRGEHDQYRASCPACRVAAGKPSKHADLVETTK